MQTTVWGNSRRTAASIGAVFIVGALSFAVKPLSPPLRGIASPCRAGFDEPERSALAMRADAGDARQGLLGGRIRPRRSDRRS